MAKQTVDFALMQFRKRPRTKNDDEDDGRRNRATLVPSSAKLLRFSQMSHPRFWGEHFITPTSHGWFPLRCDLSYQRILSIRRSARRIVLRLVRTF
jgi:hypothetical protein